MITKCTIKNMWEITHTDGTILYQEKNPRSHFSEDGKLILSAIYIKSETFFKIPAIPTHQHLKRGSKYILIGVGKIQASKWNEEGWNDVWQTPYNKGSVDMKEVAIYIDVEDLSLWARPLDEFIDGRFISLTTQEAEDAISSR